MEVVFDTGTMAAAKRGQAWQAAICEIYLQVDCLFEPQRDYDGFVREARFGAVTLTDTATARRSRYTARPIISQPSTRTVTSAE